MTSPQLPIGVAGLVLSFLLNLEIKADAPGRFNGKGFLLSGVALGCLIFSFELASRPLPAPALVLLPLLFQIGLGLSAATTGTVSLKHIAERAAD